MNSDIERLLKKVGPSDQHVRECEAKGLEKRLFISFSGGETSAFMTQWCLNNWADRYDDIKIVFANTGQEREETLQFIKQCSDHFGFDVTWVEAVVHHGKRKAPTHKVVTFETASRNGEPFEEVIKKYGVPNQAFPNCTRDLKLNPMRSYLQSIGWEKNSYDTAIGIRVDEARRVRQDAATQERIIYPLVFDNPMGKPDVNQFWHDQPFRLQLKGYEGNCKWCWKKSLRKHLTLLSENPSFYDFPERMEKEYGWVGPEFRKKTPPTTPRTFFRGNLSTADLKRMVKTEVFTKADDDSEVYPDKRVGPHELDLVFSGCSEHCEVFHTDEELENQENIFDFDDKEVT
jgi:hypothetical protein